MKIIVNCLAIQCCHIPYIATPCNDRRPLLDDEAVDFEMPFHLRGQITSSSSYPNYPPSEARMSGDGWCADSICSTGSEGHYLQVDFGAEVVVEAISIENANQGYYVTKYYVVYGLDVNQLHCVISEESNGTVSDLAVSLI